MSTTVVFTFIAADRPGLVEKLSQIVNRVGGNWLESHMSQLAGQFAGIVQIGIAADQLQALTDALLALRSEDWTLSIQPAAASAASSDCRRLYLSIIGPDRPGIVREVASALASCQINVREMTTRVSSAPMSAELLFEAEAEIDVPRALPFGQLNDNLDRIADQLAVDISLGETLR